MDSDAVVAGTMSLLKGLGYPILSISKHFEKHSNVKGAEAKGLNPGLIVLLVVGGLLISFLVGNYALYMYAQRILPPRKKKPLSKKKLKKEKLRQGVSAPGE